MNNSHQKIARILRIKPEVLASLDEKMTALTGKEGVFDKISAENNELVQNTLKNLGLSFHPKSEEVLAALFESMKSVDSNLYAFLERPDLTKLSRNCGKLCETALALSDPGNGFFIKKEKAIQMLEQFPPQNILDHFGYQTVHELVEVEGLPSVMSALRFAQDQEWMHAFFNKAYDGLTAGDFEERAPELIVLDVKWIELARKFLKQKYHNVSHLKEFGIIFVTPIQTRVAGETLKIFSLILHYLNEVPYYSKLFRKFSQDSDFVEKLKSLLRGDVPDASMVSGQHITRNTQGGTEWMVVQRYLAKDDKNDPRLFIPHVNPEAEHWRRASGDLGTLNKINSSPILGLDFVGDFFTDRKGEERLISFDLVDLVMTLVKKGEIKYLYHQQESLWNKIFIEYVGRDRMNQLIEKNIVNGFIDLGFGEKIMQGVVSE